MKKIVSLLALLGLASISLADEHAAEALDYGDFTSVTLQGKSWDALGEGQYENAVKYTEKCVELYSDEARQMQGSLSAKAPKDRVHDYWALNDVGTCYFIRGEALLKLKKDDEALAAYKTLVSDFYYAQAWDPKGWFWAPADAAAQKIEVIEARQKNDF
jgi:tetratricopeptide (TPR) repeat protein